MSNEQLCYYLSRYGAIRAWAQVLVGICAIFIIVMRRWRGWATLLVLIPMLIVMLFFVVPGSSLSFIRRRAPALMICNRGLYWQGTLSGFPVSDYFLFWENIAHAMQEGTKLQLSYYSGALLSGEEPILRNFPLDSEACLALGNLSADVQEVSTEIFKRQLSTLILSAPEALLQLAWWGEGNAPTDEENAHHPYQ